MPTCVPLSHYLTFTVLTIPSLYLHHLVCTLLRGQRRCRDSGHEDRGGAVGGDRFERGDVPLWVTVHPAPLKVEEEATVHPAPPRLVVLPVNHVIHMAVHQSGKLKCFHSAFGVTTAPVCNADSGAACGPRDLHGSPQERYFFFPSSCNEGSALTVLPPAHQTMLAAGMPEQHKG
jgi:hypothetical protein